MGEDLERVKRQVLEQLPGDIPRSVFALYEEIDAEPASFTDALRKLMYDGDVFRPGPWKVQRLKGGLR